MRNTDARLATCEDVAICGKYVQRRERSTSNIMQEMFTATPNYKTRKRLAEESYVMNDSSTNGRHESKMQYTHEGGDKNTGV